MRPLQALSYCSVHVYLYSPYGPYGLYRPSVTVQYICASTPPMDTTAFTDPQCLYSTAYILLPLLFVWSLRIVITGRVQLKLYYPYELYGMYRASLPVQYSYISNHPMERKNL